MLKICWYDPASHYVSNKKHKISIKRLWYHYHTFIYDYNHFVNRMHLNFLLTCKLIQRYGTMICKEKDPNSVLYCVCCCASPLFSTSLLSLHFFDTNFLRPFEMRLIDSESVLLSLSLCLVVWCANWVIGWQEIVVNNRNGYCIFVMHSFFLRPIFNIFNSQVFWYYYYYFYYYLYISFTFGQLCVCCVFKFLIEMFGYFLPVN